MVAMEVTSLMAWTLASEWEPIDCHLDDRAELLQLRLVQRPRSLRRLPFRKLLVLLLTQLHLYKTGE